MEPGASPPQLVVLSGGHKGTVIVLDDPMPVVFGRRSGVALPEPDLADVHCQVFRSGGRWFIQDFASEAGTWVGDDRVSGIQPLDLGRSFRIGATHVGLLVPDPQAPADPDFVDEAEASLRAALARRAGSGTDVQELDTPPDELHDSADDDSEEDTDALLAPLRVGDRIGEYELLAALGEREHTRTFKARDHRRRRVVTVSVLAPELAQDRVAVARFLRGAKAGGRLQHPNIVAVLGAGHAAGRVYVTREFVAGHDLEAFCALKGGRLSSEEVVAILSPITDAVVYAHGKKVIHRAIEPQSVIVAADGVPKLGGLSLAKRVVASKPLDITQDDDVLTRSVYAAPEAIFDVRHADERSDVYSLGATLYRAVTGKAPYRATSPADLVRGLHDDPREHAPSMSAALATILVRCLRPDPDDRFPTAEALRAALAECPEAAG